MSRQHRTLRAQGINPYDVISQKVHAPHLTMKHMKFLAAERRKNRFGSFMRRKDDLMREIQGMKKLGLFARFLRFFKTLFSRN